MAIRWQVLLFGFMGVAVTAQAQLAPNLTYDGRPTVARFKYRPVATPAACQGSDSPAGAGWGHDYPMSVQGLMAATTALTSIDAVADSNLVLEIDDPELMKHPFLMMTEPGCWDPTEEEAEQLRTYIKKGGFLFADDFTFFNCSPRNCELAIQRFEEWMKRVLPDGRIVHLSESDPLFDGFFKIDPATLSGFSSGRAQVVGIYENNDPSRRLMVVGIYRAALGHKWRYVNTGVGSGLEKGGAAYKMGLNIYVYGLSH